ncbi:YbeD family protein [Archangium sp.]|jgi:putative lipoic acid-binding regulatory protein|uniref:HP0495 family protein n=1 Tax=Archangium sp. TaxID=1872627 RepID=UPI00389AA77C
MKGDGQAEGVTTQGSGDGEEKKPLIEYPTVYTFKVMGKQAPDFVEYVRGLFRLLMGTEISPDSLREQPSSKGTYVSVSVSVYLLSEEHRRSIYTRLRQEQRVVYYL